MMGELSTRMNLIQQTLAARYPARRVTRQLLDFADRKESELTAGIYTLISHGEGDYENLNGREAMDGTHAVLLVGQIVLPHAATPTDVEDAEFAMAEEIKGFVRNLPPELCALVMKGFRQSGQLEAPYGWVAVEMEMQA